jgi:hypothetical protein
MKPRAAGLTGWVLLPTCFAHTALSYPNASHGIMVRCGTMFRLSRWECMQTLKKKHPIGAKKKNRLVATKNSLPNTSSARPNNMRQKRAGTQKIGECAARASADVLTAHPSQTVNQIRNSDAVAVRLSEGDHQENKGNSTETVNQSGPFSASIPAFTGGVGVITKSVVITMEWLALTRGCTERSMGAMQTLLRCRTPHEFFTAQTNLFFGNLNDTSKSINGLFLAKSA